MGPSPALDHPRIPSALLPAPYHPSHFLFYPTEFLIPIPYILSCVTFAPPSLVLLNPSLHSLFSSLDFHFPSVFPSSSQSVTQQTRFPSSPLVSDRQSLPPTTLRSPDCLHPAPGHLSLSCSGAVWIAHLPGYRFEGTEITGCQETQISTPLTLSSSKSGMSLPSLSPSRSLSLLD